MIDDSSCYNALPPGLRVSPPFVFESDCRARDLLSPTQRAPRCRGAAREWRFPDYTYRTAVQDPDTPPALTACRTCRKSDVRGDERPGRSRHEKTTIEELAAAPGCTPIPLGPRASLIATVARTLLVATAHSQPLRLASEFVLPPQIHTTSRALVLTPPQNLAILRKRTCLVAVRVWYPRCVSNRSAEPLHELSAPILARLAT